MITFQMNADAVAAVFLIIITVFALIASTILIGTIASSLSLRRYESQYFKQILNPNKITFEIQLKLY